VQRQPFDREYVDRLVRGDAGTERDFVAYFGELLVLKLRPRLCSPELVEDARQETFLRVLKTLREKGGLQDPGALGSYVNSVCNNVLFETYRSQSRAPGPLPEEVREERRDSVDMLVAQEEQEQVRQVLADLPARDREVLRLLFFEERDKGEICRLLKVNRVYLRVLVHRAKLKFRSEYLKTAAGEGE
jgi:RNA polymerase sigma-70 factor (ECF subfamily)